MSTSQAAYIQPAHLMTGARMICFTLAKALDLTSLLSVC